MRGHQNTKISQYIIIIIITPNFVKRYSLVGEINWWFDVMNKIIRLIIVRKTEQTEFEKEYNCSPKSTTNSETTNSDLWWSNLQKNKIPEKRNNFNKKNKERNNIRFIKLVQIGRKFKFVISKIGWWIRWAS